MDDNEFEALVDKIQGEVFREAKEILGEKGFERWRNPKFCGPIPGADSYAKLKGECGDTMEMYLKIEGNRVAQVGYMTDGCSSSAIAGSFAAEIAAGKTFEDVLDLRGDDVLQAIGRFPENERHCAHLAVRTLQEALNRYLILQAKAGQQEGVDS
jgi:nitrogen fixation NifU-like protein